MAIHANSTTAPAHPLLPFVHRPSPPVNDPRSAEELLEEIRRTIEGQVGVLKSEETEASGVCPTAGQTELPKSGDTLLLKSQGKPGATAGLLPARAPLPSLSAALSRRRAIFGGLAVAAVPVAALPAAAALKTEPSAEATSLEAEFRALTERYRATGADLNEAEEALVYPPKPEAMFVRPGDRGLLLIGDPGLDYETKRAVWQVPEQIDALRARKFGARPPEEREEALARRDEIVVAFDTWEAAKRANEDAVGYTGAFAAWMACLDDNDAFRTKLVDLRSTDLDVMRVKAMVVLERCGEAGHIDVMVSNASNTDGAHEEAMAHSLVRDFITREGLLPQGVAHA